MMHWLLLDRAELAGERYGLEKVGCSISLDKVEFSTQTFCRRGGGDAKSRSFCRIPVYDGHM
jgi:hypothetical protein